MNILKKLSAILLLLASCGANAQFANYLGIQQRSPTDTGWMNRYVQPPTDGYNGILIFNDANNLPELRRMGLGFSLTWDTINVFSGNYNDLSNKPTLFDGAYQSLTGKPSIPTLTPFNFGYPSPRTLVAETAYQASDNSRAAIITVSPSCTNTTTAMADSACTLVIRIGEAEPTCSTGTAYLTWSQQINSGLVFGVVQNAPLAINLPAGGYFILCPAEGAFTFPVAVDQSAS